MVPFEVRPTNLFQTDRRMPVDPWVIHETAGSFPGDLNWLTMSGRVSANWYIRRDGKVYNLQERFAATAHAGLAAWHGSKKSNGRAGWSWANLCSEGVELEGPNDGTPLTQSQISSLLALTAWRTHVRQIHPGRVVRHVDISGPHVRTAAEGPKSDPRGLDWIAFLTALYPAHMPVVAPPRCTQDQFIGVLRRFESPALPEAEDIYLAFIEMRLDPAFGLAVFLHESSCGTAGRAVNTTNWGNLRNGMGRQIRVEQGFAVYRTWLDSAKDFAQRIIEVYGPRWGLHTVERIIPQYAPSHDKNDPIRYIDAVLLTIAGFQAVNRPPVSPASIGGPDGASYRCGPDIRSYYDQHGGILTFGLALADEEPYTDAAGEACRIMRCENAIIRVKPSAPAPWHIRPLALAEACALLNKTGRGVGHVRSRFSGDGLEFTGRAGVAGGLVPGAHPGDSDPERGLPGAFWPRDRRDHAERHNRVGCGAA